ncbi:hypothetical protein AOQ84DRAFT_67920 [Glonium stellatum]|uniref:Uncharacterized protein n=1 Tax=Glonium stellatum TaxID=574774 RepID=A0A8E2EXW6_9PEZI|nr:hypothetical protein AOQ84DRAFT_67920 [Glonium stellatum]
MAGSVQNKRRWLRHLAHIIRQTDFDSHAIASLLCHVSIASLNRSALPPYLSSPGPFPLARRLRKLDRALLDVANMGDPIFVTFAPLEVLTSMVNSSLENLLKYDYVSAIGLSLYLCITEM